MPNQEKSVQHIIQLVSNYISETSASIYDKMNDNIINNPDLQERIKKQLLQFDIYKTGQNFTKKDIQNSCLLASYLLYLKKSISEKSYQHIFGQTVFDQFLVHKKHLKTLDQNMIALENLELNHLNIDVFGTIYNTLFSNIEQAEKGQHFTDYNEIDIINAFCISKNTLHIVDTACGSGAFLIRAFEMLKHLHPKAKYQDLSKRIHGIEINTFSAYLAKINSLKLNLDYSHQILNNDFSEIKKDDIPNFDTCIGNPPYIRQELIKNKDKWAYLVKEDFNIKNINKQSDLYVYYLMHTTSLLKEGGRLGYVIASSWLDVSYGKDLQKFLLDHFKIVAIIDQQDTRSFKTASVNTVVLIIEKCSDQVKRENHLTKFVKIKTNYSKIIGDVCDENRLNHVIEFVESIENTKEIHSEILSVFPIKQGNLEAQSTKKGKYHNGHWGAKYLRSPEIYHRILSHANNKLIPLRELCNVQYGIKTGANHFFYLIDETQKASNLLKKNKTFWERYGWYYSKLDRTHYIIDRKHIKPILKTQREVQNLTINQNTIKLSVLDIKSPEEQLSKSEDDLLKYIKVAESSKYKINQRPTCAARKSANGHTEWYQLGNNIAVGDFIFPSKIGERFCFIDNRKAQVYCDKVNYNICIKPEYTNYADILFAILNSTIFRFFIDLFSRQLTGSQTLSDVDVNVLEDTLILHPKYLLKNIDELSHIMESMNNRAQKSIFQEMDYDDRKQLDSLIMKALGFNEKDTEIIRNEAVQYVQIRKNKSESLKTIKRRIKSV